MRSLGPRLSAMMFLQFFIWGAWYTTIAVYMSNHGMATLNSWPFRVNPIAAIAAPFFVGLVADRYFATQKALGVLHLLGGLVLLAVPRTAGNPTLFIFLLLIYNLCYMPTLGLTSSSSRASACGGRSAGSSRDSSSASCSPGCCPPG